jgi:hypothetical protein
VQETAQILALLDVATGGVTVFLTELGSHPGEAQEVTPVS